MISVIVRSDSDAAIYNYFSGLLSIRLRSGQVQSLDVGMFTISLD